MGYVFLKRNIWLLAIVWTACQQGAMLPSSTPFGATDPASSATAKKELGEADDPGMGDIGKVTPGPGSGSIDTGGFRDGAASATGDTSTSGSGTTLAKNIDPLSAPVASSDIWCPPTWTDTQCDEKIRQMMVLKSGEAISQDPTAQLTQAVRVISWPEDVAVRLGLGPEDQVIRQLREGTLAREAVEAAVIQDTVVAVREDGPDLTTVLKPGLNLVFLDAGVATAVEDGVGTSPSVESTLKAGQFTYVGATHRSADIPVIKRESIKEVRQLQ